MEKSDFCPGDAGYRRQGLMANPFRSTVIREGLGDSGHLVCHAEAVRLLRAIDEEAAAERSRVIWIDSAQDIPNYYAHVSLNEALSACAFSDDLGFLMVYVPFISMKQGRVRGVLSLAADAIAGNRFESTLAAYALDATASDWDAEVGQESGASEENLAEVRQWFAEDPLAAGARVFGEAADEREDARTPADISRESATRLGSLDPDPDEVDEPFGEEAFAGEQAEAADGAQETVDEADDGGTLEERAARYVIYYAKKHLSPVVARAILAYVEHGWYQVAQELRVTSAPRKTLKAVAEFASHRFRRLVIVMDQFEGWHAAQDELKYSIATALSEIRLRLADHGMLIFVGETSMPELESQFEGARRVPWTFEPLVEAAKADIDEADIDEALVGYVVGVCSFEGDRGLLSEMSGLSMDSMEERVAEMGRVVDARAAELR